MIQKHWKTTQAYRSRGHARQRYNIKTYPMERNLDSKQGGGAYSVVGERADGVGGNSLELAGFCGGARSKGSC